MPGPPALAWLDSFCGSTGFALDAPVVYTVEPTVNPLVYKVKFQFLEHLDGERSLMVWNLFQKWAAKNDTDAHSKIDQRHKTMTVEVAVKRLSGIPRNAHPLDL